MEEDLFGFFESKVKRATAKSPAAEVEAEKPKKGTKKAAAKKAAAKKAATKKAATKKSTTKKAATKKAATKKGSVKKAAKKRAATKKAAVKEVVPDQAVEMAIVPEAIVPEAVVPEVAVEKVAVEMGDEGLDKGEVFEGEPPLSGGTTEGGEGEPPLSGGFTEPGSGYRATPFWSWNCALDEGQLLRQIDMLKQMGMGGFHMHPRTGMATEYLGEAFMSCVKACVDKARDEGMLAWLYDEDRWPSGFGGGLVTRDKSLRARSLRLTPTPYAADEVDGGCVDSLSLPTRGKGELLARYKVVLENGLLVSFERLAADADSSESDAIWYAYLEVAADSTWYNNQAYVDTLNPKAIERFRDVTYERYAEVVGDSFGSVVPAIFTDEPQVVRQKLLPSGDARQDCVVAYTDDFDATYREAWGESLLDCLPELFWDRKDGVLSRVRWRYRDHVAERFAVAFSDTLGTWCEAHGIALTGHMMEEPTLARQTSSIMEAMRHYRSFQLPGVDMLCDRVELTTVKQAASAAHQYGREGVLSELYGVTNWDFPFEGHKRQGDWQAALGVTVRVPHLTWVSMKGNAKRDYPASIGYQSPWYKEYPLIEDHFARVNYMLTQGRPYVRVGVIHPIESYWLCSGPRASSGEELERQDRHFQEMAAALLYGQVDFDYICEALLPTQVGAGEAGTFRVGEMAYDVVVVPALRTIRSSTLARLEAFLDAGGEVLIAGALPDYVDGEPSERAGGMLARSGCRQLDDRHESLLAALERYRELRVVDDAGNSVEHVLYQIREDGERRHLFLCCNATEPIDEATASSVVRVAGRWGVTLNDTFSGDQQPLQVAYGDNETLIPWRVHAASSLLLTLAPQIASEQDAAACPDAPAWRSVAPLPTPVPVALSEPNVLLLDMAEFRIADAPWQHREEILRAENIMREELGWPAKTGFVAQPWCVEPSGKSAEVGFRFFIESDVRVEGALLAVEDPANTRIELDGEVVPSTVTGWWTDESIRTVPLPVIEPGRRELVVTLPMTPEGSLEWLYLLGDFGVALEGRRARLTAPVRELAWGDWTSQGLPFYAGNVTYRCRVDVPDGMRCALRVDDFGAPLLTVDIDGVRHGAIAFDPYRLVLPELPDGEHEVAITAYGSRVNAFGAVHTRPEGYGWWGPGAWQERGDRWTYDYALRRCGVLVAPEVDLLQGACV